MHDRTCWLRLPPGMWTLLMFLLILWSVSGCASTQPPRTPEFLEALEPCRGVPPTVPPVRTLPLLVPRTLADWYTISRAYAGVAGHNGEVARSLQEWFDANCKGTE